MDDEIDAIERNETWELSDLPKRQKTIGGKWVYKTKLKEDGEIDKYKRDWWLRDTSRIMVWTTLKCLLQSQGMTPLEW